MSKFITAVVAVCLLAVGVNTAKACHANVSVSYASPVVALPVAYPVVSYNVALPVVVQAAPVVSVAAPVAADPCPPAVGAPAVTVAAPAPVYAAVAYNPYLAFANVNYGHNVVSVNRFTVFRQANVVRVRARGGIINRIRANRAVRLQRRANVAAVRAASSVSVIRQRAVSVNVHTAGVAVSVHR